MLALTATLLRLLSTPVTSPFWKMFPISSDGVFEDLSIFFEDDKFLEDLLVDSFPTPAKSNGALSEKGTKKRARKQKTPPSSEAQENNNDGSSDSKKTAHRVIEKQRRQEMSGLYASLRSLLPLEYIKGKRAVSDHMHQAVNYINDTKKKIEEIKMRRDILMMKKQSNVGIEARNLASDACTSPHCVKINLFTDGLEILISSSLEKESFPLSRVLKDLVGRELNVINCVSTRGDRCFLYKIQIELKDSSSIDLSELQEGLVNVINCV